MTRITEKDLVLPALYVIDRNPGISTGELIIELRSIFKPEGEDAELSHGRSDDKFSQIVRNLVSHHHLDDRLQYTIIGKGVTNTPHKLTDKGKEFLQQNLSLLEGLLSNNFSYSETKDGLTEIARSNESGRKLIIYDENIFISEGRKRTVTTFTYERSKMLRERAIEHYSINGVIVCKACGFDFYKKYGEIGKGFIEIHHQKPIFQYDDTDFINLISVALQYLVPLCSNCHRIIHRKKESPLSTIELIKILNNH